MSRHDDAIPAGPPEGRADAGPPLAAPNFDARSVRRARAAVPLPGGGDSRWAAKLPWIVVALVAGMIGGLLGIWAISYYQGADADGRAVSQSPAPASSRPATQANANDAAAQSEAQSPSNQSQTTTTETPGGEAAAPAEEAPAGASPASATDEEQLRGALAGWIDATNARDLERQMSFYGSQVGTFYLARNASREAVRAEKSAVFARATRVDVRADPPQIFLSADGRTATMRFRKQFQIEGSGIDRRGAVLQELRWRRTPRGWKIVGERDLRVID